MSGERSGVVDNWRRRYSNEEVEHLYELSRTFLENGNVKKAEAIITGLVEVAPEYLPGWLARSYIYILNKDYDDAVQAAQLALQLDPGSIEAMLFVVACSLTIGDYNRAGTYLGEVGELIEINQEQIPPHVIRMYRGQLARYQSR